MKSRMISRSLPSMHAVSRFVDASADTPLLLEAVQSEMVNLSLQPTAKHAVGDLVDVLDRGFDGGEFRRIVVRLPHEKRETGTLAGCNSGKIQRIQLTWKGGWGCKLAVTHRPKVGEITAERVFVLYFSEKNGRTMKFLAASRWGSRRSQPKTARRKRKGRRRQSLPLQQCMQILSQSRQY